MFGDLFLTPLWPLVYVVFAQAQYAIAVRLKPGVFASVAGFDPRQGVPVDTIALDSEPGACYHEIANKRPHGLLGLIGNAQLVQPAIYNHLDFGALYALVMSRPCTGTVPRTKARALGKRWLGFIVLAAPLACKFGGRFVKPMVATRYRAFPRVHTVAGAKPALSSAACGPYPKLFAAYFAVAVDAILRSHGNALAGLRPTITRAIARSAVFGSRQSGGKCLAANLARSIDLLFKRLAHALLGAIELVLVFLAAYGASGHCLSKRQTPGCAMSLSRRRGFRGLVIADYMQFA